jgi:hypothetical protein
MISIMRCDLFQLDSPSQLRFSLHAVFAFILFLTVPMVPLAKQMPRDAASDRDALIAVENEWLNARDPATLGRILAPDFVHPVAQGFFLTKAEHIEWFTKHPPPPNRKERFDRMQVRLYGDVGIVNGVVIASDEQGKEIDRIIFTDIFVYRNGRWQAVNGQENGIVTRH